mmetsp:Transcript_22174/g.31793  ORF Transcript_22174/g.31793 Transcript_22174/m.31793 type:complete len:113 (-) Transcript_22174:20-358(-)
MLMSCIRNLHVHRCLLFRFTQIEQHVEGLGIQQGQGTHLANVPSALETVQDASLLLLDKSMVDFSSPNNTSSLKPTTRTIKYDKPNAFNIFAPHCICSTSSLFALQSSLRAH